MEQAEFSLYTDVILLQDLPEEEVYAGDIGSVVEHHFLPNQEPGCSVEFFDMLGNIVAVVTKPLRFFRSPTKRDRPAVRLAAESLQS